MSPVFAPFLLLLSLLSVQEQQPPQEAQRPGFRIGVAVDQVFLSVNARSHEGGFVKGLTKEDFQVYEDDVKQEIVNFYSEAVPVHAVLLVDVSGSTRESQGEFRRAALRFAKSLSPDDRIAIITFSDKAKLILDWTNDLKKIEFALDSIYAKGNTVLNDALYVTFDDLLKTVEGKKAVILLTDGVDTGSMVSVDEALELATRSEAMIYIVSKLEEYWASAIAYRMELQALAQIVPRELKDEFIIEVKRMLHRLAHQTGGKVLSAKDFGSLTDVYAQVAEEIKNQYYISYSPFNVLKDGKWRNVEIRTLRQEAVVSTRPGYFAPLERQ